MSPLELIQLASTDVRLERRVDVCNRYNVGFGIIPAMIVGQHGRLPFSAADIPARGRAIA
jgi:hypothetical protein